MLHKTKGIVISYIAYRETSIIVKIYTHKFGVQTYIENGVRTQKGKNKIALFQPLTLLDLVVYANAKKDIQRISEIKCWHPFNSIPYDISKSSLALFTAEIITKTLQEEEQNNELFEFLERSIIQLDNATENFENFHLYFLHRLSGFLGFIPETAIEMKQEMNQYGVRFEGNDLPLVNLVFVADFLAALPINKLERSRVLNYLLSYYKIHIDNFGELKSLTVLKEVLG